MLSRAMAAAWVAVIVLCSCSSEPDFVVKTGAEDAAAFEPVSAQARFRPDTRKVAFTITNFEVGDEWYQQPLKEKLAGPDQRYIMFSVPGEKGVSTQDMLKTGEHDISHVEILTHKEGPGYQRTNLDRNHHQGKLTISEVTETQVKGSIDVSDEKGVVVKGDFTADRV